MNQINISEEFKKTIKQIINSNEDCKRVDHIMIELMELGLIDGEYEHLIFSEETYNAEMDQLVADAIEDEVKRQLLLKYNE